MSINLKSGTLKQCVKNTLLTPSKAAATANIVLGLTSEWSWSIAFNKFGAVSFTPGIISENLSVLAVHNIIT